MGEPPHPPPKPRKPRYHTKVEPRVQGFDTEACRGDLLLICSPTSKHEYHAGKNAPQRLLAWLWREADEVNFFYNIAYDRDVLLKPLAARMKAGQTAVSCGPFTVKLLGNKSFALSRADDSRKRPRRFFDVSPFFSDGEQVFPLDETARIFLGEGKLPDVDRNKLGSDSGYYAEHREEVIRYCKRDAELAARLGKLLVRNLKEALGFCPSRFNSKASISKAWVEVHHPELLRYRKPSTWSLARDSYRGGIFLTPVLGRVERATELDLVSAYGDALRRLPRFDRLERRVSFGEYHADALLGAYKILTTYDGRMPLDPALRGKKRGSVRIVYPDSHGELRPYTATKAEMDYLIASGRPVRVLMAEEWFGPYEPQFPEVEELLARIARLKTAAKAGDARAAIERMLYKTIVNALYGCLAESKHGETPLTNWPLAAEITARCRVKIWTEWDRITKAGGRVLSVNTDSLRYVPATAEAFRPSIVGEFETKFSEATVRHYLSGIAIIEERGKAPHLRKRGKPLLTVELLDAARGPVLKVPSKHVTHLFEALARDRREDIGVFDDPNDPEDDTTLNLQANLWGLDFDIDLLRFEVLNEQAVSGRSPDFDEVTQGRFDKRASSLVKENSLRLLVGETHHAPSARNSRTSTPSTDTRIPR